MSVFKKKKFLIIGIWLRNENSNLKLQRVKNILFAIAFILIIKTSVNGQSFINSNEYKLTTFKYSDYIKLQSKNEKFDGYMSIFITDKKGDKLKEIKVYGEFYENDASVEELENINLFNVKKVIKVQISECACYCNTSIYYWIITNQNVWINLPVLENEDYEFEMKYKGYVFSKNYSNIIELKEYQDEQIDKKLYTLENIRRKSEKVIQTFIWNGKKLNIKS